MSLSEANRLAFANVMGVGAGAALSTGAMSLVATFGTASTGTAISSLSGAAATNATLAWFGGGSIAAGGGGVAMGTVVLSGGTLAVGVVVTATVLKGMELYDQRLDSQRVALTIQRLKEQYRVPKKPEVRDRSQGTLNIIER